MAGKIVCDVDEREGLGKNTIIRYRKKSKKHQNVDLGNKKEREKQRKG